MANDRAEITVAVHRCLENPKQARTNSLLFQVKGAAREQACLNRRKGAFFFYISGSGSDLQARLYNFIHNMVFFNEILHLLLSRSENVRV